MRIAVVVERFPSLSETFVLGQVAWLIDAGHDVTVFSARRAADGLVHPDVTRLDLVRRTRFARAFGGGHHRRQLGLGSHILGEVVRGRLSAREVAGSFRAAGMRGLPAWTYPAGAGEFDAVIAHFGPNGVHALEMRRAGVARGPLVTVFHGYDMNPRRADVRRGYRTLFERGALFLPVSDYFRERLLHWGAPADRTLVHHMGVDPERFAFRERKVEAPLRLISVARLVPKKGLDHAIRAAARLGERVDYTLVGDGPERGRLAAMVDSLGAGGRIRLAGWQTQDQVSRLLQDAHALVAPSVTPPDGEEEGIPVALMEAMASGLPVIASRHSGIPELVEDGRSGLLVSEGDRAGLEHAMRRLLEEPDLGPALARTGRAVIERDFNSGRLHPRLVELLHAAA